MKKTIIRITAFLLIVTFVVVAVPMQAAATEGETLCASRIGFDNKDISAIITSTSFTPGDLNNDTKINAADMIKYAALLSGKTDADVVAEAADYNCDGKTNVQDANHLLKTISGLIGTVPYAMASGARATWSDYNKAARLSLSEADGAVRVNLSNKVACNAAFVVVNSTLGDGIKALTPVYSDKEVGSTQDNYTENVYNGARYYSFNPGAEITSLVLSLNSATYVSEVFVCENEYSAKWIIDNRINPSSAVQKTLSVQKESEKIAIRLGQMTSDDKTNTNGGLYHDFTNTKWPTVAVDENDKLYVVASGCRMSHVDPYGATVMVTSQDGGKSFSKPRQISNTIMDDRDAGIAYLGEGKFLVSYFTNEAESYLPGGSNYNILRLNSAGGGSASWTAASWDSAGNPSGGIGGTYIDMVRYVTHYSKDYAKDYASFVIKTTDYGESWSARPYECPNDRASTAIKNMINNYQITYPGTRVPVTSAHGPLKLSNGTVLFAGKVLTETDQKAGTMAAYASYDDGDTWSYYANIATPCDYTNQDFHELSVTETADGALVCAIRSYTIYTCFSYDKGKTWTTPAPAWLDGYPAHLITDKSGNVVMVTGDRNEPKHIKAYVSEDGGRTWSTPAQISDSFFSGDDMGYPAVAQLSSGTFVSVYYGRAYSSDWNSSIRSSRWTYTLK